MTLLLEYCRHFYWQGKFEYETPVAVGPLPKAYYALEAYTDETWNMVTVVFSVIKIMLNFI